MLPFMVNKDEYIIKAQESKTSVFALRLSCCHCTSLRPLSR